VVGESLLVGESVPDGEQLLSGEAVLWDIAGATTDQEVCHAVEVKGKETSSLTHMAAELCA